MDSFQSSLFFNLDSSLAILNVLDMSAMSIGAEGGFYRSTLKSLASGLIFRPHTWECLKECLVRILPHFGQGALVKVRFGFSGSSSAGASGSFFLGLGASTGASVASAGASAASLMTRLVSTSSGLSFSVL